MRHAEGRGAYINVDCQGPFLEAGMRRSGRLERFHHRLMNKLLTWTVLFLEMVHGSE
jgi:hypothetical protein